MILTAFLLFISGFLYESGCVFWVHYMERNKAVTASICSMFVAICQIVGIGGSLHDWRLAPFFVLGYGAGTFVSTLIKQRIK